MDDGHTRIRAITRIAQRAWSRARAARSGTRVRPCTLSEDAFDKLARSRFGSPTPSTSVREYLLAPILGAAGSRVSIFTSSRKTPSACTFRVIRATAETLTRVFGPRHGDSLKILMIDGPCAKVIPSGRAVETRDINSGFYGSDTIVVFRRSEMHRTLVHEMVHAWGTHGRDRAATQEMARRDIGAPRACLLTEAYVEAMTWLIFGGFCAKSLDSHHALREARAFLKYARDDGATNGWAYFVGRALLVSDMGRKFANRFAPRGVGVRLESDADHSDLVSIMRVAFQSLGGPGLPRAPEPQARSRLGLYTPIMCSCDLGRVFTQSEVSRTRSLPCGAE